MNSLIDKITRDRVLLRGKIEKTKSNFPIVLTFNLKNQHGGVVNVKCKGEKNLCNYRYRYRYR